MNPKVDLTTKAITATGSIRIDSLAELSGRDHDAIFSPHSCLSNNWLGAHQPSGWVAGLVSDNKVRITCI